MHAYATWFPRHRALLAGLVLLGSLFAAAGLARLRFDDVPRAIFASDDAEYARLLEVQEEFGADDGDALLVFSGTDWRSPGALARLRDAAERGVRVEGVAEVLWAGAVPVFDGLAPPRTLSSLLDTDPERAASLARTHPLIAKRWISADGGTALVVLRFDPDADAIGELEPIVARVRALAADLVLAPGERVRVTGVPPIRTELYNLIRGEQRRFFLIAGVLCSLTALLLFRSVGALVATTVPPLVGGLWAFGAIGWLGIRVDLLSGVLSMVVVVIALTDSVHLMIDVRASRAEGCSPVESAARAIRHLGVPCFLTTLTTAIGFGSLGLADVAAIRHFGLLAAGAVSIAFLAVLSVLPLLASILPSVGIPRSAQRGARSSVFARLAPPFVRGLLRRARLVAALGIAGTLLLAFLCTRLVPENRLTEALPRGESYAALMEAQDAFGGVLPSYVLVTWDPAQPPATPELLAVLGEAEDLLAAEPRLAPPLSLHALLAAVPGGLAAPDAWLALLPAELRGRFLRADLGKALVAAGTPDEGTAVLGPLTERLERGCAVLAARHPGYTFHLTGTDVVARRNINRMIGELAKSLAFAAVLLFALIALEFRSLRIGLVSLVPNLLPLVLVGAALHFSGRPLRMTSAVLSTVLLGLAVDDTIHFLARLRRERTLDPAASRDLHLERTFLGAGRGIVATTLVLLVGFGVVGFSPLPTNQAFATLSCLGLSAALLGDLVLLPALLAVRR